MLLSISLFIVYTVNLPVVRPRSCRVIYYFDTLAFRRRHQSFDLVNNFEKVFENDKFILFESGIFVRKGYLYDGLFKMNVMTIMMIMLLFLFCFLEFCDMWYGLLGHMNYNFVQMLINLELLCSF
jgi:hypothetical protein